MVKLVLFSLIMGWWVEFDVFSNAYECDLAGSYITSRFPMVTEYRCCNPNLPECEL